MGGLSLRLFLSLLPSITQSLPHWPLCCSSSKLNFLLPWGLFATWTALLPHIKWWKLHLFKVIGNLAFANISFFQWDLPRPPYYPTHNLLRHVLSLLPYTTFFLFSSFMFYFTYVTYCLLPITHTLLIEYKFNDKGFSDYFLPLIYLKHLK